MTRNLPLTALRVFEAAGRMGSFRLAAEQLLLTPSAVSHAVRKLEAELSTTLFSRDGRNLVLTPEGEDLMHHVERGFAELWRGVQSASAHHAGLLRLHCAPSFAAKWLGPRLAHFFRECPGIEVRLAAGTDEVRFAPRDYDADIAYGLPRLDGLVVVPLGEEQVAPLCTPALAARIAAPSDLLRTPLIESDNKKIRWDAWFAANGLVAPAPHGPRFDRSFLAIAAAVDGLGVALESHRLAEHELRDGRLVEALPDAVAVRYVGHYLTFPRVNRHSRALVQFADWLMRELALPFDFAAATAEPAARPAGRSPLGGQPVTAAGSRPPAA